MPTKWKLRELLKERGVKSASEISRSLEEIGHQLSVQAVCDLLNRQPKMIRSKQSRQSVTRSTFRSASSWKFYRWHRRSHKRRCELDKYLLVKARSEREGLVQVSELWIMPASIQMRESFHQGQQRCKENASNTFDNL